MPTYKELAPRCAELLSPTQRMNVLVAIDDIRDGMEHGTGTSDLAFAAAQVLAMMHNLQHPNWAFRGRCHEAPPLFAGLDAHICWLVHRLAAVGRAMAAGDTKDAGVALELLLVAFEHIYTRVRRFGEAEDFRAEIADVLDELENDDAA